MILRIFVCSGFVACSATPSAPHVIWKSGQSGGDLNAPVLYPMEPSCAPLDVDTVVHGDSDTAALHTTLMARSTGALCNTLEFVFLQPTSFVDYMDGAIRFELKTAVPDLDLWVQDSNSATRGRTLSNVGFVSNSNAFSSVVFPMSNVPCPPGIGCSTLDPSSVVKILILSGASTSELWIDDVRWTAN